MSWEMMVLVHLRVLIKKTQLVETKKVIANGGQTKENALRILTTCCRTVEWHVACAA